MVSIIIPLRKDQGFLRPCINACLDQRGAKIEVIVLPDEPLPFKDPRIIQEVTGPVSPAKKRNRGAELAKGEILAFIDDDTAPRHGWLEAALRHFQDGTIGAVGGPSVTPAGDPFWAQVGGAAYESWMLSGHARIRYRPEAPCDVEDFPSCNLLVRKTAFQAAGGFGTNFWPGEDTAFCLALIREKFRIRYEPEAVIEHHRRASLASHFRQLASYGLHRGYFVKRFPETSCRPSYFAPSLMVMAGAIMVAAMLAGCPFCATWFPILLLAYFALVLVSLREQPFQRITPAMAVVFLSHIAYGVAFLRGLLARRLPEEC
jgi:glycosyltransferase involved in cell wall biosynthesis